MRRTVRPALVGLLIAASAVVAAPAHAAAATSHWEAAFVSDVDPPVAGETVELYAYLRSESAPIAGRTAILRARTTGAGDSFRTVATVTTDAAGKASSSLRLLRTTDYRWMFAGDSDYTSSSTSTLVQGVASKVIARGSDLTLARGQVLQVYGRAYPNQAGQKVRLWMGRIPRALTEQDPPRWLETSRVRSNGTFRLSRAFYATGSKRLFVEVVGDASNLTGYSDYILVKVR